MSSPIPAKSRAVFVTRLVPLGDSSVEAFRRGIEVREVDTPQPGPGEVLIRVAASPINPSDTMKIAGQYNEDALPELPFRGGNEGSGTVVAAGAGAEALVGRAVGFVAGFGAWADYVVQPAARVMPLPEGMDVVTGSSPFVNPVTAAAMVEIAVDGGHKAVVMSAAASALVKMFIRHAAEEGVATVCTVRKESQVGELKALGAAAVVVTTADGWQTRLADACKEHDARLAFDAVAGPFAGELLAAMPNGSEVQVYGALSASHPVASANSLIFQGKRLVGFWLVSYLGAKTPQGYGALMAKVVPRLATTLATRNRVVFPLDQVPEALADYAADMSSGKVLIGSAKL